MSNQTCYNRDCTYNSGYKGYGCPGCAGDELKYKYCTSKMPEPYRNVLYEKLDAIAYDAFAIDDVDARTVIRNLVDVVKDILEEVKGN